MAKGKKTGGRDFKPGNNANPHGRPRVGLAYAEIARDLLEQEHEFTDPKTGVKRVMTYKEALNQVLLRKGLGGDLKAIEMITRSAYGDPDLVINQKSQVVVTLVDSQEEKL